MSRRRDDLKALFAGGEPAPQVQPEPVSPLETKALVPAHLRPRTGISSPSPAPNSVIDPFVPPRSSSGALKAMGLELDGLKQAAAEATALRSQLSAGELVATLDPALIESAFIRDRMMTTPAADAALEASLAAHGQQVPVLVRPHPRKAGSFEAVYGHRRIAALTRLGKPVRALVRSISDDELVIAQGQENNARLDLSFIERARFAAALEARGFSRSTIIAALGVHKSDITRYVAVVVGIDSILIDQIGPAPRTGRASWQKLSKKLDGKPVARAVQNLVQSAAFAALESDVRFKTVMALLVSKATSLSSGERQVGEQQVEERQVWQSADGGLTMARDSKAFSLRFSGVAAPEFSAFLHFRLDALHTEFQAMQAKTQKP